MKKTYLFSLILMLTLSLVSCGGGGTSGSNSFGGKGIIGGLFSKTTVVSGTVFLSRSVSAPGKPSAKTTYKVTATGTQLDKVLDASGVKSAVLPPLINATIKLYNADRPDWVYPVAQVFSDSSGLYKFDKLTNADLNLDKDGNPEYENDDEIPAGNYTIIAANDTTVSGGKQYVAVQAVVKRFEGLKEGNDLVVQDSDASPAVTFMLGLKPNDDGSFGGADTILPPNAGIQIVFNMAMARLSVIDAVKVYGSDAPTTPVSGAWKLTPDLLTATFYPENGLVSNATYTIKVAGGATNAGAAVNVYGKPLASTVTAVFTADIEDDTTNPNAILYQPFLQTNVPITTPIQIASRYEPLDINTMVVSGSPSIGDKPAVNFVGKKQLPLGPANSLIDCYIYEIGHTPLALGTDYVIRVSEARDMSGNLLQTVAFNFKTQTTSSGITGAAGSVLRADQIAVKDVFGKWINAMNTRNAALLTTYMTGDFFWLLNGWTTDDKNRDGRLNLSEFRDMLAASFEIYEYCDSIIDGDITETISIDSATASIQFELTITPIANTSDPKCVVEGQTLYADLKYINSGWLVNRGADVLPSSYPAVLDIIALSAPGNGAQFSEPTESNPLYPNFVWQAVANATTYAVILMEAGSSDTGWVALVDGRNFAADDTMTMTFTPNTGYTDDLQNRYVLASGPTSTFGFTKSITKMKPAGYYHWAVLGFNSSMLIPDINIADLIASSRTNNFSVANNAPPSVISVEPSNLSTNVITRPTLTAVFSEAMNGESIISATTGTKTFTLTSKDGTNVSGAVAYDDTTYTATFVPTAALDYETEYTARISTGAMDVAGNHLAVEYSWGFTTAEAPDTTPPVTTATPAGGTYNSTVNVALSSNEEVQFILYTTNPASSPTLTYTGPIAVSSNTTLKFLAKDLAGNQESVKTEIYTIDKTTPITNISPKGGYFNTATVSVTLSTEPGANIYFGRNGATPTLISNPTTTSITSAGSTQLGFYAVDAAGNAENIQFETYTIDTTAPDTTITTSPDNPTRSRYANFTFSSNETDVAYECKLDSGSYAVCTSPFSQSVSEGAHTFTVRAKDKAANYDADPASHTWTYDITPPTGSIQFVDAALVSKDTTTTTSVKLKISAIDNLLTVDQMQFSYDGEAWYDPISYATTLDKTISSGDGPKTAFIRFKDAAGNWSGPYGDTINLDTAKPSTTITETPPNPSGRDVTFQFSASEPVDHFVCNMDSVLQNPCTSPKAYAGLADGTMHTFSVQAVDKAGLADETPDANDTYTWKVDTLALVTTASPVGGLFNATVPVTLTPTGTICSTTTYWCLGANCTAWITGTSVSVNASNTLRYYSVETGGGACTEDESTDPPFGTSIKQQVYTVDSTPPETTITSGTQGTVAASSATFYFSASETSTFECSLDGGGYTACSSPISYAGLVNGGHSFSVYATDSAGNADSTPATRSWTVDLAGPVSGSVSINSGTTYATSYSVSLSLSASDTSGVAYALISNDATSWSWYSWTGDPMSIPWSLSPGDGTKVVYVQFRDSLGNVSTTYSDSIILDSVAPNTTISSGPSSPTTSRTATFYFYSTEAGTFQCNINNTGWNTCTSPASFSVLNLSGYPADGTFSFSVKAIDFSGLSDQTPASYGWTLFTGYWDSPGVWDYSNWNN